jgi:UDP-N-acetylglucosamine acyltransferase
LAKIHPFAVVDASAIIADDVEIGPGCIVDAEVTIGAGTVLQSHARIYSGTTLGENNYVGHGAVLGGDPQDRKFQGEKSFLKVGNNNTFREYVTVHRATGEGLSTVIGNDLYLMANAHIGHNCELGNHITIANNVALGGHAQLEDYVNLGGYVGLHQFSRVGKVAMVGAYSKIVRDVPPFMIVDGIEQSVIDINAVGLRRYGISPDGRLALHRACKLLFKSQLSLRNAMEIVRQEVPLTPEVEMLLRFEEERSLGRNGRARQR